MSVFYTYVHYRASDRRPFYVGKGSGNRAYVRTQRSELWGRICRKHGLAVEIAATWSDENDAFLHERLLITCFRELGFQLCNLTDGGDGVAGAKFPNRSVEHARKISDALKGHSVTDAQKAKLRIAATGRAHSDETISKIRISAKAHADLEHIKRSKSEKQRGALNHRSMGVLCVDEDIAFGSIREAARWCSDKTERSEESLRVSIALCCKGRQRSLLAMRWVFAKEGGCDPEH